MRFVLMKKEWDICPYESFFIAIGISIFSLLVAFMAFTMFKTQALTESLVMFPIAMLFAVGIMMNMGDNSSSAKELFWGWIIAMLLFLVLAAWGWCLISIFGVIT